MMSCHGQMARLLEMSYTITLFVYIDSGSRPVESHNINSNIWRLSSADLCDSLSQRRGIWRPRLIVGGRNEIGSGFQVRSSWIASKKEYRFKLY